MIVNCCPKSEFVSFDGTATGKLHMPICLLGRVPVKVFKVYINYITLI